MVTWEDGVGGAVGVNFNGVVGKSVFLCENNCARGVDVEIILIHV